MDLPGGAEREDDYFVTLLFRPPRAGASNAIVLTTTENAATCQERLASASPLPAGGKVTCRIALGGTQALELSAGSANGGRLYWMIGSTSGTSPGFPVGGFTLPLNVDFYFLLTVSNPNLPPLTSSLGVLDGAGEALACFGFPPGMDPGLAGIEFDHAYGVFDGMGGLAFVSNAEHAVLVP